MSSSSRAGSRRGELARYNIAMGELNIDERASEAQPRAAHAR